MSIIEIIKGASRSAAVAIALIAFSPVADAQQTVGGGHSDS